MRLLDMRYNGEYIIAMGDTIDCVALVNYLTEKERLLLPCLYLDNVKSFFPKKENLNHVRLNSYSYLNDLTNSYGALKLYVKREDKAGDYDHFEIIDMYEAAGLDYDEREKYCTIKSQASKWPQLAVPSEPYAFVPEGGSPGTYRINREHITEGLRIITPPQDAMMLAYADIIKNATEIHCHPTSWPRLIEKLDTDGKLFMHTYVREVNIKPENWFKYKVLTKEWNLL